MSGPARLADSVTTLTAAHAGQVVITGSHGGRIAAMYAANAHVRAVVFNDAGRGLDDAGIAGLAILDTIGIAAAAVSHASSRIGDAHDTLASGIVSVVNEGAHACGVTISMTCEKASKHLAHARWMRGTLPQSPEARIRLAADVVGCDSIGLVREEDAGAILVIGSHGALHGGDPHSALAVAALAAFFHDAGRGKDDAGVSRLPVLAERGIAAAAVDYRTARIGDARSLWMTGALSAVNAVAGARGIAPGMTVREAAARLRAG
jgi:hypothetical protein